MTTTAEIVEQLRASEPHFLTRVRLRAARRVMWMRALWAAGAPEAQGLAITDGEVDRILSDPAEQIDAELSFYERHAEARALGQQIREADALARADERWARLRHEFSLSESETDLLSLAVAAELDPLLRRVYGYLHDDANFSFATPWLAASLFGLPAEAGVEQGPNLLRWRLAYPAEGPARAGSLYAPWVADAFSVQWLASGRAADPVLGDAVEAFDSGADETQTCLYPDQLAAMRSFVKALQEGGDEGARLSCVELQLAGPAGAGKRTLAAQFSASLGLRMLAVDSGAFTGLDEAAAQERVARAARLARLEGALLYWHDAAALGAKTWRVVRESCRLLLTGAEDALPHPPEAGLARKVVRLPSLTRKARLELWRKYTSEPAPEPVAEWVLTPAEVAGAARVAPAGRESVVEACRDMLYRMPGELFTTLPCPYQWEDIVLQASVRDHLAELEAQARLRWPVYEEWGFGRLCSMGRGVSALFAGPSGTGKTMAAQVLARSLQMDLYRVDLAGVVNKYIGETEKRLKQVFDACERANVLLLFDEADALFGQRTQVKDAHDRFANIEIDYLLQRMEQFDGIAVLATNRKGDIDKAFMRRLRFIIDFMEPGPVERLALWHKALLPRAPDGQELLEELDWDFLASKLNMTGADIKAAALGAAFLARAENSRIGMRHILYASRREMSKHGVVLRAADLDGQ